MLEAVRNFLTLYWHVVVPIIVLMFMAVPVIVYWYQVRYWLMKVRIGMPWIGRIKHWIKEPGDKDVPSEKNPKAVGFFTSEADLCRLYETYYRNHQPSEAHFRRCQDYLGKIDEDNRREKGFGLWFVIIALMVIEASAFGFALAPYALTLATPNTAIAAAFALGLVISCIALFLSEFAGRELYLNSVVGKIMSFEFSREKAERGDMRKTHIVTLDNTNIDDKLPHYQQMLNRVKIKQNGDRPSPRYGVVIAYAVFILALAVAAFWVRTETLNAQESELISNPPSMSHSADDFPVAAEDDFPIPTDMQAITSDTAGKSAQDQIDALHRASLVTFAVLSGLFIFIQLTSTFLAYIYGFAGTYSRVAWELIHKFSSADDFVRHHAAKRRDVATDAQQSLSKLQALRANTFRASGTDREEMNKDTIRRTFTTFIDEQDAIASFDRHKEVVDNLAKNSQGVIVNYIEKTTKDLNEAIAANDNDRINQLIEVALPRFDQITDPAMVQLTADFYKTARMFGAKAPVATAPAAPVVAAVAVEAAVTIQPTPVAPAPVPEAVVVAPEPVAPAPAPVAPAPVAAPASGFDPYQFGDLTEFHEDDLSFVAQRKGVELDVIKRALRLQRLDKQSNLPV